MVTDWPAAKPCAVEVVMVTRKPFSAVPLGLADCDRGGLRRAAGARGNGHDHVFIDNHGPCAGAALADTVEIRVVELARQVVAGYSVADGEVFPAEKRGGMSVGIRGEAAGDGGKRAGSGFLVQIAVGVEEHGAQRGVQRLVRLDVVDGGIAGEWAEERLQAGTGGHAAGAKNDVLAIGRDAVREVRRGHICHEPAENFDGRVK
jgi:hypothetical protein